MDYSKRIRNLEKKYSETNINSREVLFPSTVKKINKTYNDNQQKRRVDTILNNIKNKDNATVFYGGVIFYINKVKFSFCFWSVARL